MRMANDLVIHYCNIVTNYVDGAVINLLSSSCLEAGLLNVCGILEEEEQPPFVMTTVAH